MDTVLPFGRHRGTPLSAVPTDYLQWMLRDCRGLSHDLREAVAGQLASRGADVPGVVEPVCSACGPNAPRSYEWHADDRNHLYLRCTCTACGRVLCLLAPREPFVTWAERSPEPLIPEER